MLSLVQKTPLEQHANNVRRRKRGKDGLVGLTRAKKKGDEDTGGRGRGEKKSKGRDI